MVLAFGVIWIKALPFGYTESALLYLAAIVAASAFLGRPKALTIFAHLDKEDFFP